MSEHRHQLDANESATRETIRTEILRSNTAVGLVLAIVLVLALAVVITGARATRNQQRAERAEADGTERLWNSYIAQARALRLTAVAGRRAQALEVISNAAAIRPSSTLRTEAVASLALTDLVREGDMTPVPRSSDQMEMDALLEKFAYGDAQGLAYVAQLRDGKNEITLDGRRLGPGFNLPVQSVALSPDGKILSVRHAGGAFVAWEVATHDPLVVAGADWTNHILVGMSYSADSRMLYFSDPDRGRQITVFNLATRQRLASGVVAGARPYRFRPGKPQLALMAGNRVDLMEHPSGAVVQSFEQPTHVFTLAWSPDGAQLAVSCEDGDVWLWDVVHGTHRLLRGHSESCLRLGFSPDGKLLFTGSRDGTTRLWDTALAQLVVMAEDGVGHIFSPDGKRLGFLRLAPSLGTWEVQRSDCFVSLQCPPADGAFLALDLSMDGRWCVATQTKGFRVWDLEAGDRVNFFPVDGLNSARIAPDGKSFFVCRTNGLERWPMKENSSPGSPPDFDPPVAIPLPDNLGARNVAVSGDGGTAAVELMDLRFATVDLHGKRPAVIFPERWRTVNLKSAGTPTGPGRFAISPDGRWVATGFYFGASDNPRVWDAQTAKVVASPHMATSLAAFSADGRWLGLSGMGEFQIYSTADWKCDKTIPRDEMSFTHGALAFMGDGGEVACTRTRQQVQLRAAQGEERFLDLIAPSLQSVSSLRVSSNGNVLAIGSARDVIQVWRLKNIHHALAGLNLDWGTAALAQPAAGLPVPTWFDTHAQLTLSGLGFLVVALLSLLALRRHRMAIERFFAAENTAAERHRDLEAAKLELMHSQKMQALGTLATGIAHDFNNLLSVIRMSNKLIGRETKANAEIQENVTDIEQAVMQGKSVVGSMLGYARTESDVTGPTDFSSVVEETVSLLSKEFLSGIALTLELDREAPQVNVSRGRLEQMLLNLIVNASEAMQGNGKLKIALHRRHGLPARRYALRPTQAESYLEMIVADSGPGIAAENQLRIFEPFFTTKRAATKAGTGLGLSLVYAIAQQDGLGLSVECEPDKGAIFAIVVPIQTDPVPETHSSQTLNPP